MFEAISTEEMFASELDGFIKGRVADEADQIAVCRPNVFEKVDVWWLLGDGALAVLRIQ